MPIPIYIVTETAFEDKKRQTQISPFELLIHEGDNYKIIDKINIGLAVFTTL